MTLREKAVKGVAWSALGKWGNQAISLVVFTILARLLDPDDFGLIAMATVFTAFLQLFLDQGMSQAIVQREIVDSDHLNTAFWINILIGLALTVVGILFSGLISNIYNEPELDPIVSALSLNFLIASFSSTQAALLRRELRFRSLTTRTLIARIFGGVAGIIAALLGYGVWSLVIQTISIGLVSAIVLWQVSDWRPQFSFSVPHLKELYSYGINIVGIQIMYFINNRGATFLIGYFLGATALGYFAVGNRLVQLLKDIITGITSEVALPTYSRLQNQTFRLRQVFYKTTHLASFISFPAFLGLVVLAPDLIPALFGEKWIPSIPLMQILAFGGLHASIFRFNNILVNAVGKPSWVLALMSIINATTIIGFFIIAPAGLIAITFVYAFVRYIFSPVNIYMTKVVINIRIREYFQQFVHPILGSVAMIFVIQLARLIIPSAHIYISLSIYIISGIVTYLVYTRLTSPTTIDQLLLLARQSLPIKVLKSDIN